MSEIATSNRKLFFVQVDWSTVDGDFKTATAILEADSGSDAMEMLATHVSECNSSFLRNNHGSASPIERTDDMGIGLEFCTGLDEDRLFTETDVNTIMRHCITEALAGNVPNNQDAINKFIFDYLKVAHNY